MVVAEEVLERPSLSKQRPIRFGPRLEGAFEQALRFPAPSLVEADLAQQLDRRRVTGLERKSPAHLPLRFRELPIQPVDERLPKDQLAVTRVLLLQDLELR